MKRLADPRDLCSVTTSQQPPQGQYPNIPPAPQVSQKKRRRWPWIVAAIILLIIIVSAANSGGTAPAPTPSSAPAPAAPAAPASPAGDVITYEVSGSGSATNITYIKDKNMGQEQVSSARLPWSKQVTFDDGGPLSFQPLSLIAQAGQGGGSITCRILRDGQELTSSTSSGPFSVVTCSAQ